MKTCKRLGIKTVAVYSEADASAVSFFFIESAANFCDSFKKFVFASVNSKAYNVHIPNCKLNFALFIRDYILYRAQHCKKG